MELYLERRAGGWCSESSGGVPEWRHLIHFLPGEYHDPRVKTPCGQTLLHASLTATDITGSKQLGDGTNKLGVSWLFMQQKSWNKRVTYIRYNTFHNESLYLEMEWFNTKTPLFSSVDKPYWTLFTGTDTTGPKQLRESTNKLDASLVISENIYGTKQGPHQKESLT